ncbi:MAG TPA: hypothetical protein VFK37_02720, partial [Bacillales bacterium]|nr:hypothetical protein [Bacillales bacterium]
MEKVLFSWSGGKDSSLALYDALRVAEWEVVGLLTTFSVSDKVPMHEVNRRLIESQAEKIGIPLVPVYLPEKADNEVYEQRMREKLQTFVNRGVKKVVHGDIFLEDVRDF